MYTKPKKRLGQNFLIDKNIQRKIISSYTLKSSDIVLEVGAGSGQMTRLIAPLVKYTYALEIDSGLCAELKENLKNYSNARIINKDILKFDLVKGDGSIFFKKIEPSPFTSKKESPFKVVGNIPYYITTPIIERLITWRKFISDIYLTVQKEVAQRIVSLPHTKEYSSFSCLLQYYTEPKILFTIKNTAFFPRPKVDSCLLRLKPRKVPLVAVKDETFFFSLIRRAFNQRRKVLTNSLKGLIPKERLEFFFRRYNLNLKIRPEELSLQDFANLSNTQSG